MVGPDGRRWQHLEKLLLLGSTGYVEMSVDGVIRHANAAACRLLGFRRGDVEGSSMEAFLDPGHVPLVRAAVASLAQEGDVTHDVTRTYRHQDGHQVRLTSTISALPATSSAPAGFAALVREATQADEQAPDERTRGGEVPRQAGPRRAGPGSRPGSARNGPGDAVEDLIRAALRHDRVRLVYQPVFELSSGRVVSVEALLRLPHPSGHTLPPAQVVPVAEASGLIVELGRHVLRLATDQAATWLHRRGAVLPVAVNVSAVQLGRRSFSADVLSAISRAGVPASALSLELTETVLLHAGSDGMEQLRELDSAGVRLAIDDFGTGYASLTYLRDLPATTLKIDRSFVQGIPDSHSDMAIVAAVIGLAKNFGLTCIAEGIETPAQLEHLAARGALGQGFLLARPGDAAAVDALLLQGGTPAPSGQPSEERGSSRDHAGDLRDEAGDERDVAGDRRDREGDRRDRAGDDRDEAADLRDEAGDDRDTAADRRDALAEERDEAGSRRDRQAAHRDQEAEASEGQRPNRAALLAGRARAARQAAASDRDRASKDRQAGADERALTRTDRDLDTTDRSAGAGERSSAEIDRNVASADRGLGAGERHRAEGDRTSSRTDRGASAEERRVSALDELTGAYSRDAGLQRLAREITRVQREGGGLTLAFVDADHLKFVNDAQGHAAGDRLLQGLFRALQSTLRSHDLVLRYGGDEFLCAMTHLDATTAGERLRRAAELLAGTGGAFTFGVAELGPGDTEQSLIERADAAMRDKRGLRSRRGADPGP